MTCAVQKCLYKKEGGRTASSKCARLAIITCQHCKSTAQRPPWRCAWRCAAPLHLHCYASEDHTAKRHAPRAIGPPGPFEVTSLVVFRPLLLEWLDPWTSSAPIR